MEEFWVCPHCRSLNRASAGKCYSCKQKYGTKPKAEPEVAKAAAAAPLPPAPRPAAADFSAAAQPAYLVRPVAMPPAPRLGAPVLSARPARRLPGLPHPVSAVKGRIAASLASRPSVTVTGIGYATIVLLLLLAAVGTALVVTVLPVAAGLLQHADPGAAWTSLTAGEQSATRILVVAFAAIGIVTLAGFSLFLGLTTHNATGLGADMPMLTPYGGGVIWPAFVWTHARIAVGMIVPVAILWMGYEIPGLIAALVAVEIAQRHMDDPFGWLARPYRHLPDLYAKLGVGGSIDSRLASLWSLCFRLANVFVIATYAIPLIGLLTVAILSLLGREGGFPGWQSTGLGPTQIAVGLVLGSLLVWTVGAVLLLVPLTVGLVQRQRTRRTMVRVGRSRSWVARPGQGGYTPGPTDPNSPDFDPDDRVIEHYPRWAVAGDQGYAQGPETGFGPGAGPNFSPGADQGFGPGSGLGSQAFSAGATPGFGPAPAPGFGPAAAPGFGPAPAAAPGFGPAPAPGFGPAPAPAFGPQAAPGFGPGFGPARPQGDPSPDQASLYSPSTTSSFPWSDEPPASRD